MARAKYLTDHERDVIRIAVSRGLSIDRTAKFLRRNRSSVYREIVKMRENNTLQNKTFDFMADYFAAQINAQR